MVCFLRESFEPKRKVKLWQTGSPVILFLIVAILMDVNWHCAVFLISISLMFIDAEHLCMCLLAVCVSFLEKYLFKSFIYIYIYIFFFF